MAELQDAGNTTTLAHYLELLSGAGMVAGLQKFSGSAVRQRASSPKLQVFNTALLTAQSDRGPEEAFKDPQFRGRLVESAIGAHLINASAQGLLEMSYWRDNNREVDFVLKRGKALTALEVKSGCARAHLPGMAAFAAAHRPRRILVVRGDGISLEEFLMTPAEHWL